jgi:hypothetical protein
MAHPIRYAVREALRAHHIGRPAFELGRDRIDTHDSARPLAGRTAIAHMIRDGWATS